MMQITSTEQTSWKPFASIFANSEPVDEGAIIEDVFALDGERGVMLVDGGIAVIEEGGKRWDRTPSAAYLPAIVEQLEADHCLTSST